MSVKVPVLDCCCSFETFTSAQTQKKETFKKAVISLNRNEFSELVLNIAVVDKSANKSRNVVLNDGDINIHRKFVNEGKLTLDFKGTKTKLFISNAPRNELTVFVKSLASKMAGNKDKPKLSTRTKLLSERGNSIEEISPVTSKDIKRMQVVEAGGKGLLKSRGYTPKVDSPLSSRSGPLKRKMLNKENCTSPMLKKEESTPRRGMIRARRTLQEVKAKTMTKEQKYVLDMVRGGKNVFFTGGAGTGKSFLINKIIGVLPPEHTFITASTGVAAFQIGGTTLHTFAGIGHGTAELAGCVKLAQRKTVNAQWRKCKHLIIDEISMIDGNYFKMLEAVARTVKGSDKPFGGIQLILTGDFLQLPPVTKGDEERRFAFETSAWLRCVQVNIELTEVKRQTDENLVSILNRLRVGECGEYETKILAETKKNNFKELKEEGIIPTKLCTHTDDVKMINSKELNKCQGDEKVYRAQDSDENMKRFIDSNTPVEDILRLRIGAQVMLLKNLNVTQGLVNGARGAVQSFSPDGFPIVKFIGGRKEEVKLEKWMIKTGTGATLVRLQLPLRLAWAFSIHKSQGLTLDCVEVSLSRVFECGQAYVALSRAKSLESLRILDFKSGCVRADVKVIKFYRNLQCESLPSDSNMKYFENQKNKNKSEKKKYTMI